MKHSFELAIDISEKYDFDKSALGRIGQNKWVKHQWPLVYFIENEREKIGYVGESTNAAARMKSHLSNPERLRLNKVSIIGSDKFNKSATLDLESSLIQYLSAEGTYTLQNGNYGLVNHSYYQKDIYGNLFKELWHRLIEKKIVTKSLTEIENSEVFKYSPFKSLNEDQYRSVLEILQAITANESNRIFVSGSAGTGKTVLATYLMKLLVSQLDEELEDYNDDEFLEVKYIKKFQKRYPRPKIGLVIAMTSLRESLQAVFRKVPGLKASMVMSPSDTFNAGEKFDLLIVDEAHRLRQFRNIGWMGAFRKNNQRLNLDDSGNELDWILANSKNQILFYDAAQSVKPSDISENYFERFIAHSFSTRLELKSQMRVQAGPDYIRFVDDLLNCRSERGTYSQAGNYELFYFDSLVDLYRELAEREKNFGLSRLVAGYSWPWLTDPKKAEKAGPELVDIEIDGLKFKWNSTASDWVNSPNAFGEVGCIHTTQGYDLNYVGVIFGKEIDYNKAKNRIEILPQNYHDINGKKGVVEVGDLEQFIINIYKTLMYRGIKGAFVYACNANLRDYLAANIPNCRKMPPFRRLKFEDVKPYLNAVPLIDISVAAGNFSEPQLPEKIEWVELPVNIAAKEGYFVCQVVGESMNKIIPNGSYCLFKQDEGGTREGKIVLVQAANLFDADFGAGYTVKQYHSEKKLLAGSWSHMTIELNPISNDGSFETLNLEIDGETVFKVLGIFDRIL